MNIAIGSTPFLDCPPKNYGGLEIVQWNLVKGLIEKGHKVVLFATDDSQEPEGGFLYKCGKAKNSVNVNWLEAEKEMWLNCRDVLESGGFDIIHFANWFGWEYASKSRKPELKVTHGHHGHLAYYLDSQRQHPWWAKPRTFPLNLIAISRHMKEKYETGYGQEGIPRIPAQVCYNGIDLEQYPYQKDKSDRFLFLGRIDPIKGVHTAIEVAEKTGVGLDVVGATSFVSDLNYVEQVKAKCKQLSNVEFIGEVSHRDKVKYLQDAKGLLAPSTFEEPFGLHLCESMACGTPVIGSRDGALPEVIEHGKTGFICDSVDMMVESVGRIDSLDSRDCRDRVERRFTYQVMSKRYEQLYKMILEGTTW